jgi:hypothetical protein
MHPVLSKRWAAALLSMVGAGFVACSRDPVSIDLLKRIEFPDSITRASGLPPRANTESMVALGDTVFFGTITGEYAQPGQTPRLAARLVIRDTSASETHPRTVALAPCAFSIELSRFDAPTSVVWRSDRAAPSALACPTPIGGNVSDLSVTWPASAVLGDSLPAARYHARLAVKLADGRIVRFSTPAAIYLDASTQPLSVDYSRLRFRTSTAFAYDAPLTVRTTVYVINPSDRPVAISWGGCFSNTRFFRTAERTGTAAWRSEFRRGGPNGPIYMCPAAIFSRIILPGDSLAASDDVEAYAILGDSLPVGRYFVSVDFTLLPQEGPARGTEQLAVKLPAGEVDLSRVAEQLPSSRTIDGVRYLATTRVIDDRRDTIRTLVLVTNTTSKRVTTTIASKCPLVIFGYRKASDRDAIPGVSSQMSIGLGCPLDGFPISLEPGQSWVFGNDISVSEFRSKYGGGRFYFAAVPTLSIPTRLLAAGEINIP